TREPQLPAAQVLPGRRTCRSELFRPWLISGKKGLWQSKQISLLQCRSHQNPQETLLPNHYYFARFAWPFSQSFRNCSRPRSVSGCLNIMSRILNGIVATCAPAVAASTTCMGCRNEAASTCVL